MANIVINRSAMSQKGLESTYNLPSDIIISKPLPQRLRGWFRSRCTVERIEQTILGTLPFIEIMRGYKWKKWLPGDIVSGLSVGCIQIPQGMGFALLAELPAVYGLYASFWPILFYFFFGTSRHISMGTTALISIMVSAIVLKQMEMVGLSDDMIGATDANGTVINDGADIIQFKVGIVMSVSLLMGLFLIIMSYLRLGVIATYMSMPFVRSFMTGAGINIIANQIPALFQIKMPPIGTMFKSPRIVYEVLRNITQTNVTSFVTGIICIIILYVLKEIVNTKYRKQLRVPIPAELLVFVSATIIAHFGKFHEKWGVRVIGEIPLGMPPPALPSMYNWTDYVIECFVIAVVSFAISISMAKMMAKKHGYKIDTNQELMAYGLSYGLGALFQGHTGAQAPPRSVVQDMAGGKTQVASLVSSVLVLLFVLVLGQLFTNLPNSVLAAIIIVALIPLMKSFLDLKVLWKGNKLDFITWLLTIVCVVFLDITAGLIAGLAFSVFSVTFHGLFANGHLIAEVENTGLYAPVQSAESVQQVPGVKVFRFNSGLYFINIETFRQTLFKCTFNPTAKEPFSIIKALSNSVATMVSAMTMDDIFSTDDEKEKKKRNPQHIQTIVIDCTQISYIDIMGLNLFTELRDDFKTQDVNVVLSSCNPFLLNKLAAVDIILEDGTFTMDVYPSVHDAVMAARKGTSSPTQNNNISHV